MLGDDCKLYYDLAGAEQGSWVEADVVMDDGDDDNRVTAKANCRGFAEIKTHVGKSEYSLSGNLLLVKGSTALEALRGAYQANTSLGIAVMDGDIATSGSKGWWRDMKLTKWSESRPEGDVVKVAFELATDAGSSYVSNFKTIA